jgi:hypothetical protein
MGDIGLLDTLGNVQVRKVFFAETALMSRSLPLLRDHAEIDRFDQRYPICLSSVLHNVGEVVYDSTFCAKHQIEIAEANVEIDNDDILPRLS